MSHESRELTLFAVNDAGLYRQRILPIITNLKKKIAKGVYDPILALKLWKYAADDAAQRYTKEFDTGRGFGIFTPQMRRDTAKELQEYYDEHLNEGNTRRNPRHSLLADHAAAINPKRVSNARKRKARRMTYSDAEIVGYAKQVARTDRIKSKARGTLKRIALQAKFSDSLIGWVTVHAWDDTPANLKTAISHGKIIHRRNPSLPVRVVRK